MDAEIGKLEINISNEAQQQKDERDNKMGNREVLSASLERSCMMTNAYCTFMDALIIPV